MQTSLHTPDGVSLHLRHWAPGQAARGTVLLVHGLGEHIGRYAHVAAHLNAGGWHVVGYDQRGHGASGGGRGAVPRWDSLLCDLGQVVDMARVDLPRPLVLVGHSMGGLVAGRFVAEGLKKRPFDWWRKVDALVMSSPALDAGLNWHQRLLLAVSCRLLPGLALGNGLDPAWVSRDPHVVEAYRRDPLVHDRITPRLARFIVDQGELVRQLASMWRMPTALIYAGADKCVAPRGSDGFAAVAPPKRVWSKRYERLAHEIFNEPEQRQVLADLTRWLDTQPALARAEATA
jgi:alpha-beta hydrolase superfamily lysophospholipase